MAEYDKDSIIPDILDRLTKGESLRAVCETEGYPAPSTFCLWVTQDEKLAEQYARARELRGEHYGYKVSEIGELVLKGDLDPNAARVAMDSFKWTAARMASKAWGDKIQAEHTGNLTVTFSSEDDDI